MPSVAALDHVSVTYVSTGETALRDVSLHVDAGELLLLAGPSGCGKTALMRVLNGLVPHAYRAEITGTVTIEGQDAKHLGIRDMSRSVGTLLQNPERQVVAHSVLADIAFGLENRGVPRGEIAARVDEVAAALGISDDLLTADTHELSGGQMQLVAFAGVLVARPRLIIVDEPLANLDADAAVQVLQALRGHVDSGGAAIVIEHRVADVIPIGPDRVLYLEEGQTRYHGDSAGFVRTADPQSVKLPFEVLVARAEDLAVQRNSPSTATKCVRLAYTDAELGYRQKHVVHQITADFFAGQRIAVLGRNGAGKTTLLRAAVGLVDTLRAGSNSRGAPCRPSHGPLIRAQSWTNWLVVAIFVACPASVNGLIVGAHRYGTIAAPLFTLPLLGAPVSAVSLSYAMTMVGRFAAITATGFPLAFALRPGDLAPALSRLGVPDRFAFAVDLTFRLLPTIATSMRETIAAQRLRGYEVGRSCNPIRRIRQAQPLIIPVTVSVFVDAEDIADALDLRCFGTHRRTWLRTLRFDVGDVAVVALAVVVTAAATVATITGYMPPLWVW